MNAVADATAASKTVADHGFTPAALNLGTTYYWRVDEVNEAEVPSVHEGDIWSFTTQEYPVVEDFESYDDEDNRIYDAWMDGMTSGRQRFQVGYMESPFAEQTIIHGGKQSMPLAYDNTSIDLSPRPRGPSRRLRTGPPAASRACRCTSRARPATAAQLYVKINNTKVAYNGDAADIAKAVWLPWNIDLSKVGGNLSKVTTLTIGVEGSGAQGIAVHRRHPACIPRRPSTSRRPSRMRRACGRSTPSRQRQRHLRQRLERHGHERRSSSPPAAPTAAAPGGRTKLGYADLGNRSQLDFGAGD